MRRAEFEAELRREGYEIREGAYEPNTHREAHVHAFDARALVLEGSLTLVFGSERVVYGPGDCYTVLAGTRHEEYTGAEGMRYVAGLRPGSLPTTAR